MRVDQLSGDSTASELRYMGGVAELRWADGDTGQTFRLRVITDCLYSEVAAEAGSVHAQLVPLADALPVDPASGRYVAPAGFGPLMAAVRDGLHLALGRRAVEIPYLFVVRGYRVVLACPVPSTAAIEVLPEAPVAEPIAWPTDLNEYDESGMG